MKGEKERPHPQSWNGGQQGHHQERSAMGERQEGRPPLPYPGHGPLGDPDVDGTSPLHHLVAGLGERGAVLPAAEVHGMPGDDGDGQAHSSRDEEEQVCEEQGMVRPLVRKLAEGHGPMEQRKEGDAHGQGDQASEPPTGRGPPSLHGRYEGRKGW
jgi:hypothetical protein